MERTKTLKDPVDVALDDSFPASDPPAWNMGHDQPPPAGPPASSTRRGPRHARRRHPRS